jgi:hypothetical protein
MPTRSNPPTGDQNLRLRKAIEAWLRWDDRNNVGNLFFAGTSTYSLVQRLAATWNDKTEAVDGVGYPDSLFSPFKPHL